MAEVRDCYVREGRFVEPCEGLESAVENISPAFSKASGIARWTLTNMKERKPSRTMFGIKSKKYPKGMLFNFCPFCGAQIDAPFAEEESCNG